MREWANGQAYDNSPNAWRKKEGNQMFEFNNPNPRPQFTTGQEHFRRPRPNPMIGAIPRPGLAAPGAPGDTPSAPLPKPDFTNMPPQSPLQGGPAGRRFPRLGAGFGMPHGRGGPRNFGQNEGPRIGPRFGKRLPGMEQFRRRPPAVWNAPGAEPGMPNMRRRPRVPNMWRRGPGAAAPTAAPMAAPAPVDPNQPV